MTTQFLSFGIILGLSAGFAPGPLLTLVISETLQHNIKSGIKVAVAPLITDLPIIFLTVIILKKLSDFHQIIGLISLVGSFFILFLGIKNIMIKKIVIARSTHAPQSLLKGIITNTLSPHPYLFWSTVGAPTAFKAMNESIYAFLAFLMSFYILLIGSKLLLALLTAKSKHFLQGDTYLYIMRLLGFTLCILAFALFREGLRLLWT